ncbi:MAG: hypothetical protein QOJ85_2972, partial [Solirubrobacteraceae bacterium]|nr:hypothetical protein [Solirubrobacteraceae bacterium]
MTLARPFGAVGTIGRAAGRIGLDCGAVSETRRAFMSRPVAIDQSRMIAIIASKAFGSADVFS